MKIKSMTASFGKLDHETLTLGDGLNLISAPNEGGKSTWCAFLCAMLYGIDTRDRNRKGHLAEKNHYQPWSGVPMEGELNVEYQGRDITIRRGPSGNTPFGSFSAVYTGTDTPVPDFTSQTCGELLTGVGREVFERSALIGGGEMAISASPELEKRIAALVSSGQEDVSYSEADAKLKSWLHYRRLNRSNGRIPTLEGNLDNVNQALDDLSGLTEKVAVLEGRYTDLQRQRTHSAGQVRAYEQLAMQDLNETFAQADSRLRKAKNRLSHLEEQISKLGVIPDDKDLRHYQGIIPYLQVLEEEIRHAKEAITETEDRYVEAQRATQQYQFAGMTAEEARSQVDKDLREYASLLETMEHKRSSSKIYPIAGLVLTAVFFAFKYVAQVTFFPMDWLLGIVPPVLGFCIGAMVKSKSRVFRQKADKLLSRWSVSCTEDLEDQIKQYEKACQLAKDAADELKQIRWELNDKEARRGNEQADLLKFVHSFAPEVHSVFGCSAAISKALTLKDQIGPAREAVELCARHRDYLASQGATGEKVGSTAAPDCSEADCKSELERLNQQIAEVKGELDRTQGALASKGDPASLTSVQEGITEELNRRTQEYDALTVAADTLKAASAQLQSWFSPELNTLASAYLARLTGEHYSSVTLNQDMEGSALQDGDVLPHSALYLSRGTVDQLYLAVRLAVCKLCLPELPPIVLDDAFTAFDDERLKLALDLVTELAQNQQIILFSCQKREGELLAGNPDVTRLELAP